MTQDSLPATVRIVPVRKKLLSIFRVRDSRLKICVDTPVRSQPDGSEWTIHKISETRYEICVRE